MNFKFNRNNRILRVELKNLEDKSMQSIHLPEINLNKSYISVVEQILAGEKVCSDYEFILVDEIVLEESMYQSMKTGSTYEMTGSGLTMDNMNIYSFDLFFGKISIEKIGNKKKTIDNKLILKNVKIKLWPDGEYSARETAELMAADTKQSNVSISMGEQLVTFKGI